MYTTKGTSALKPVMRPRKGIRMPVKLGRSREGNYTVADFEAMELPQNEESWRYELCDGHIFAMAAPTFRHADIVQSIYQMVHAYLEDKPCKVYIAGVAIRLKPNPDKLDKDEFIPDLIVICDKDKEDERSYNGPPKFVIEVSSKSTASHDRVYKRKKYEEGGVEEYWIVSPDEMTVSTFILKDGRFEYDCYGIEEEDEQVSVPVTVLPGLEIDLNAIFAGGGEE
jgi:Uma2 family endonuclease